MANQYIAPFVEGLMSGYSFGEDIKDRRQMRSLREEEQQRQKAADARADKQLGLQVNADQRAAESAALTRTSAQQTIDANNRTTNEYNARLGLYGGVEGYVAAQKKQAEEEAALKRQQAEAGIQRDRAGTAESSFRLDELRRARSQEENMLGTLGAWITAATDPRSQSYAEKVDAGVPTTPDEDAYITSVLSLPELKSRLNAVHPASSLIKNPSFLQQLESVGQIVKDGGERVQWKGGKPVTLSTVGTKSEGRGGVQQIQENPVDIGSLMLRVPVAGGGGGRGGVAQTRDIPIKDLNFTIVDMPTPALHLDPNTGKMITELRGIDVTSDKLPGIKLSYNGWATSDRKAATGAPEQIKETPIEALSQRALTLRELAAAYQEAKAAEPNITPKDFARYIAANMPKEQLQSLLLGTSDNQEGRLREKALDASVNSKGELSPEQSLAFLKGTPVVQPGDTKQLEVNGKSVTISRME